MAKSPQIIIECQYAEPGDQEAQKAVIEAFMILIDKLISKDKLVS